MTQVVYDAMPSVRSDSGSVSTPINNSFFSDVLDGWSYSMSSEYGSMLFAPIDVVFESPKLASAPKLRPARVEAIHG